ncbi:MAG: ABC transporter, ATP-binding protein (cluster 5, nickel/peptides/opines), partial [uncultured Rubellimicrobium sp.]
DGAAPVGPRPSRELPNAGRRAGERGGRRVVRPWPRTAGDRGRKRVGKVHDRARHSATDPPPGPGGGRAPRLRGGGADLPVRAADAGPAGRPDLHGHAGPALFAEPGDDRGPPDRRGAARPRAPHPRRDPRPRDRDAAVRPHQRPRARGSHVSARGVRRDGPADHDRDDADPAPQPADRRRAHERPRCQRAGAGAGPHGRPREGQRDGADPHQPRSRPCGALLRPHPGDERGPGGGNLRGAPAGRGHASLHARAPRLGPPDAGNTDRVADPRPAGGGGDM